MVFREGFMQGGSIAEKAAPSEDDIEGDGYYGFREKGDEPCNGSTFRPRMHQGVEGAERADDPDDAAHDGPKGNRS